MTLTQKATVTQSHNLLTSRSLGTSTKSREPPLRETRSDYNVGKSPGRIRARSPVLAWARAKGLPGLSPLQLLYIGICENKVMPPVAPDIAVLDHLVRKQLKLNLDFFNRERLKAIIRLLESQVAKEKIQSIEIFTGPTDKSGRLQKSKSIVGPDTKNEAVCRKFFSVLGRMIGQAQSLQELRFHVLKFGTGDLRALGKGLAHNKKLEYLSMAGSQVGDEGMKELCLGLSSSRINILILHNTGLSPAAAPYITRIIKAHGGRREEAAWSSSLRGGVIETKTETLKAGILLLDLSSNQLNDASATILAEALEGDIYLLGINLVDNQLGPAAISRFKRALDDNQTLLIALLRSLEPNFDGSLGHVPAKRPEVMSLISKLLQRNWPGVAMHPPISSSLQLWKIKMLDIYLKMKAMEACPPDPNSLYENTCISAIESERVVGSTPLLHESMKILPEAAIEKKAEEMLVSPTEEQNLKESFQKTEEMGNVKSGIAAAKKTSKEAKGPVNALKSAAARIKPKEKRGVLSTKISTLGKYGAAKAAPSKEVSGAVGPTKEKKGSKATQKISAFQRKLQVGKRRKPHGGEGLEAKNVKKATKEVKGSRSSAYQPEAHSVSTNALKEEVENDSEDEEDMRLIKLLEQQVQEMTSKICSMEKIVNEGGLEEEGNMEKEVDLAHWRKGILNSLEDDHGELVEQIRIQVQRRLKEILKV